jgi:hypothetical protein
MGDGKSPWCSSFGSSRFFWGGRLAAPKNSRPIDNLISAATQMSSFTIITIYNCLFLMFMGFMMNMNIQVQIGSGCNNKDKERYEHGNCSTPYSSTLDAYIYVRVI